MLNAFEIDRLQHTLSAFVPRKRFGSLDVGTLQV